MTNPIFEHLPPGPQREEAEVESHLATARETIARTVDERDAWQARALRAERECDQQGAAAYDLRKERDELLRKWKEFEASPSIEDSATLNGYQRAARRTCPASAGYVMPALGLTGEAGEYADEIKKIVFHGKPVDEERLAKELGDVLWYVAIAARSIGMKLSQIAAMNISKLRARYPDGFSAEASAARADEVTK